MPRRPPSPPDVSSLFDSWMIALEAQGKSPETRKSYAAGVRLFLRWCAEQDRPATLDRRTVEAFVAHLLATGAEPATARARHLPLRRFSAWLAEEGEIERDDLLGVRAPKIDTKITPVLSEESVKALIDACKGAAFRDRRDMAIVRLMLDTGARAGEVIGMTVEGTHVRTKRAEIKRGKGGKGRVVPFGPQTAQALDRYLRVRRTHRLANTPALWLGDRGKMLRYDGLYDTLRYRARRAGIGNFHPHVLRHTAASRWLAAGGGEGSLMAVAGWTQRSMIDRYTASTAAERAIEDFHRMLSEGRLREP